MTLTPNLFRMGKTDKPPKEHELFKLSVMSLLVLAEHNECVNLKFIPHFDWYANFHRLLLQFGAVTYFHKSMHFWDTYPLHDAMENVSFKMLLHNEYDLHKTQVMQNQAIYERLSNGRVDTEIQNSVVFYIMHYILKWMLCICYDIIYLHMPTLYNIHYTIKNFKTDF